MLTLKLTPIEQVSLLEGLEELYRQGMVRTKIGSQSLNSIMEQLERSSERAKLKDELMKAVKEAK
jgi:hypothetical protein